MTHTKVDIRELISNSPHLGEIVASESTDKNFEEVSVADIIEEFKKPGRDPRPVFKTALLKDGVEKASDLTVGTVLEGVVTNVTNFGAFVDIGVHQDGLVHIAQLSDVFVKDLQKVVKSGDVVRV